MILGGRAGVTDTMAAALWTLDVVLTLTLTGTEGVNFHVSVWRAQRGGAVMEVGGGDRGGGLFGH